MVQKIDFTKRGKELFWMKKDLRDQKKELSENQKITIMLDKQRGRDERTIKGGFTQKIISLLG